MDPMEFDNSLLPAEMQGDLDHSLDDENVVSHSSFVELVRDGQEFHGRSAPYTSGSHSDEKHYTASTETCADDGIGEGRGLATEETVCAVSQTLDDNSLDEFFRTLVPLEEYNSSENIRGQPDVLAPSLTFDLEELLHVQTASPNIAQFEGALTATSQEPIEQISNLAGNVENPICVQVPADGIVFIGESEQAGDSVNQSCHHGYEGNDSTRTEDSTWLAGCSMETQTGSPQGSAVCQPEALEPGENMLISTRSYAPEPEASDSMQLSPPAQTHDDSEEDPQAARGMENFHEEPCLENVGGLPRNVDSMELVPMHDLVDGEAAQSLEAEKKMKSKKLVDLSYTGVSRRFDGRSFRFEANYEPPGNNGKVFLGEFSTQEEAKDAYNVVALLHEGTHATVDLQPYTVEKYVHELHAWQGKHHADLVCELRLKGRGLHKDGSKNYKHVDRRLGKLKKAMRFEGKVSYEDRLPDGTKKRKCTSKTFDTAEEAAEYADIVEVENRGKHAWTNFPLSRYLKDLDKDFLPTTVTTRIDRTFKRAKSTPRDVTTN